jgi:pheromone shutdown protein TraB
LPHGPSIPFQLCCSEKQTLSTQTQAITEFGKIFPGMVRPLMTERDLYLSHMLYLNAGRMKEGEVMVAVVGAGHVPGILFFNAYALFR